MSVTSLTAATPVGAAVFAVLQDAALQSASGGRVYGDVPEDPIFPFVLYETDERDIRGFGTGGLPEVTLRTHVYSTSRSKAEPNAINRQVVALLKDAELTIAGYDQCGTVFYDDTLSFPDEELDGVKCHEIVSNFRVYCEEMA